MRHQVDLRAIGHWVLPGLCAVCLLLDFSVLGSDLAPQAFSLAVPLACLCAFTWARPTAEMPSATGRAPFFRVGLAFATLLVVLLLYPLLDSVFHTSLLFDPSAFWVEIVKLANLAVAFCLGFRLSLTDPKAKRLLDTLLALGGGWAAVCILMHFADPHAIYGVPKIGEARLAGAFSSPNSAGTLFGSFVVLAWGRLVTRFLGTRKNQLLERTHLLALFTLLFALTALALTLSRSAVTVTALCCLTLTAILMWQRVSVAAIIIGGAAALLFVTFLFSPLIAPFMARLGQVNADATTRLAIFQDHYDIAIHQMWFGSGLGSFNSVNNTILTPRNYADLFIVRTAHNVYLQWFEEAGIFGSVPAIGLVASLFFPILLAAQTRKSMSGRLWTILAIYVLFLVHGLTDYGFQEPSLMTFLSVLLGCGVAIATNTQRHTAYRSDQDAVYA